MRKKKSKKLRPYTNYKIQVLYGRYFSLQFMYNIVKEKKNKITVYMVLFVDYNICQICQCKMKFEE